MSSAPSTIAALAPPQTAAKQWRRALDFLRVRIPPRAFRTWLRPVRFLGEDETSVRLEAPNPSFATHLEAEFLEPLLEALSAAGFCRERVRWEIAGSGAPAEDSPKAVPGGDNGWVLAESEPLAPACTFDTFVVGGSNRYAHAAARAVSDPGLTHSPYSPLLIYGDVGVGKTHLLQSIAQRLLAQDPGVRLLYTKGATFTRQVVEAVKTNDLHGFRKRCASIEVLLVDDLQFIAGLDRLGRSAEEFFHTLSTLGESGRQVVVTANAHPQDIQNLNSRIRSRLESGLATDIGRPTWEMRVAIVERKTSTFGVALPGGIAEKIASRFKNNVRELEGALNRIIATSRANRADITAEFVERTLAGFGSRRVRQTTIQEVMGASADIFGVQALHLKGKRRTKDLSLARHVAMYVSRQLTGRTLKEIGRAFDGRDHSSVRYAIRKVEARLARDPGLDRMVERLVSRLR